MNGYQNHTDADLLVLLQQGDSRAFEVIYRRYIKELLPYAYKNVSLAEEAEEIVQDVFVSLWSRREKLNITSLRHYLFSAVKYKIIRFISHSKVQQKYEQHYRLFESLHENAEEHDPYPQNITLFLEKGMAQLPERCQQALKLRLTENLSNTDIAQRMNISKGTVENYMVTAINSLRAYRQKTCGEEG